MDYTGENSWQEAERCGGQGLVVKRLPLADTVFEFDGKRALYLFMRDAGIEQGTHLPVYDVLQIRKSMAESNPWILGLSNNLPLVVEENYEEAYFRDIPNVHLTLLRPSELRRFLEENPSLGDAFSKVPPLREGDFDRGDRQRRGEITDLEKLE